MTGRMLHPMLQRLAALAILGIALGAVVSSTLAPLMDAIIARDDALDRLARYEQSITRPGARTFAHNPADLLGKHGDEAAAQLTLQTSVDRLARAAGIAVQSTQPLALEHLGEIGRGSWLELSFTSDLQALTDFLASLDTQRPLLLVKRLEIDRGDGVRPDIFLRVRVHIGHVWQNASGVSP